MYDLKRADPLASLVIAVLIGLSVIPLLKSTAATLLQRTPRAFERYQQRCLNEIKELHGVRSISEPHFWMLTHGHIVGTVTITVSIDANEQRILRDALSVFKNYGVPHITIQINKGINENNSYLVN
eukprot:TRINITY_DN4205_c0_g1_i4.p1 TRINITY_DN4205_c0_g1~~TRINITY_DN4205_c0_g1_i4.p1  ORF type:complete len:126 (-),score=8.47 TRINITY_DN4205_c0_g1_i4:13-390(-)